MLTDTAQMGQKLHQQLTPQIRARQQDNSEALDPSDSFVAACKEAVVWLVLATSSETLAAPAIGDVDDATAEDAGLDEVRDRDAHAGRINQLGLLVGSLAPITDTGTLAGASSRSWLAGSYRGRDRACRSLVRKRSRAGSGGRPWPASDQVLDSVLCSCDMRNCTTCSIKLQCQDTIMFGF